MLRPFSMRLDHGWFGLFALHAVFKYHSSPCLSDDEFGIKKKPQIVLYPFWMCPVRDGRVHINTHKHTLAHVFSVVTPDSHWFVYLWWMVSAEFVSCVFQSSSTRCACGCCTRIARNAINLPMIYVFSTHWWVTPRKQKLLEVDFQATHHVSSSPSCPVFSQKLYPNRMRKTCCTVPCGPSEIVYLFYFDLKIHLEVFEFLIAFGTNTSGTMCTMDVCGGHNDETFSKTKGK